MPGGQLADEFRTLVAPHLGTGDEIAHRLERNEFRQMPEKVLPAGERIVLARMLEGGAGVRPGEGGIISH
jgi:hypothetical protein